MTKQSGIGLAPHETLEIHELLRSEITGYKKLQASIAMVQDDELSQFMKDVLNSKRDKIEQMQQFITAQGIVQ